MRRLLSFLALLGVLGAIGLLLLPLAVGVVLTSVVTSRLSAAETSVQVGGWGGDLLDGTAPAVELRARDARYQQLFASELAITLSEVQLLDRRFERIDGTARRASVAWAGDTVNLTQVTLSGPARKADVTADVDDAEVERLVRRAANELLDTAADVSVARGVVRVTARGRSATGALTVERGALVLSTPLGTVRVLAGSPTDPWRFTGVTASATGIRLRGEADLLTASQRAGLLP